MVRETDRLHPPIGQSIKRTNSQAPKASGVSPFGSIKAPIKLTLWTSGVHLVIDTTIVGLLVNNKAFGPSDNERFVIALLHRTHFQRDGRKRLMRQSHTVAE